MAAYGILRLDPRRLREAGMQVDTAVRAAADEFTFDQANQIAAAVDASLGQGGPGNWSDRRRAIYAQQEARDSYDAQHRQAARLAGRAAAIAVLANRGGFGASAWSNGLSRPAKGLLGEVLSTGKTLLKGDLPVGFQVKTPLALRHTVADHVTALGKVVEAKFGNYHTLTNAQKRAVKELGERYRVDKWTPAHMNRIARRGILGTTIPAAAYEESR